MRRILLAFLFAIPFFLTPSTAKAQCGPGGCGSGGGGGGSHPMYTGFYPKHKQMHSPVYGMFSFALCMYPRIHQHGPLYNYGPYEGYYPFTPYGPWNPDLTYNSPMIEERAGHHHSHLRGLGHHGLGLGLGHGGCSTCGHSGHYALSTLTNVFHRLHPHAWHKGGCSSCGSASLPTGGDVRVVSGEADAPVIRER